MDQSLPAYRKIDFETWPRREHFTYYRTALPCGYSLTKRLDVTAAVTFSRSQDKRLYGCLLYAVSKTVNEQDAMRMMTDADGAPGVWEISHPNFTVFHKDDHTFSDLWMTYDPDFARFYTEFERVLTQYGNCHGIKGRPGQPANFFCCSCVPWLDYTGYATHAAGAPALFPIVMLGRYEEHDGRCTLPATLTISHAAADGWHTAQFFARLQDNLDAFSALCAD